MKITSGTVFPMDLTADSAAMVSWFSTGSTRTESRLENISRLEQGTTHTSLVTWTGWNGWLVRLCSYIQTLRKLFQVTTKHFITFKKKVTTILRKIKTTFQFFLFIFIYIYLDSGAYSGGAMGAQSPPEYAHVSLRISVKSIDFRGFSDPNGC